MPLILNGLPPLHWAVAGAGIAAITLTLLLVANRRLGISSGFEDLCSLIVRHRFFQRESIRAGRRWRLPFLLGLLLGGAASAALGGGWSPIWDMGRFDGTIGWGPAGKLAWMFGGGLLIGFGTRLAGGCTSGHGIFGVSNVERSSLVSTGSFMIGGIITTHVIYRLIVGSAP